jgi:hypothetical protein
MPPPELLEKLGIELEPGETEAEEQQSDAEFLRDLRADLDRFRAEPKPEPLNLP